MDAEEAWLQLSQAEEVIATKGRKLLKWSPSAQTKSDILDVVIGRSGTLRAPTIRVGNAYLVGFDEGAMIELVGGK